MILKRTYAYREFNEGFGLIQEETINMTSSDLINSLWAKFGDSLSGTALQTKIGE